MERYFRSTGRANFPQLCAKTSIPNIQAYENPILSEIPTGLIQQSYINVYGKNGQYYPQQINNNQNQYFSYEQFGYNQTLNNNTLYENNRQYVGHNVKMENQQTNNNPTNTPHIGHYKQSNLEKYIQTSSNRYNPYSSETFGSNKSRTSVIPDADTSIKVIRPIPIRCESAISQKQEGKKVGETLPSGSMNYGQASEGNQNIQLKIQEKSITAVGKVPLVGSSGAAAESSGANKRHLSEAISSKSAQDKHKNIHAFGLRVFTGSVEKVLKWHKMLSETGVDYIFEVVAKCINLRNGLGCEKHLLLRDSCGPILQAIFYEIDFLMPKIEPGANVRVVGKMISSNRLMIFKIREVLPFEQAALPRLCAISHHMINKIHTLSTSR